MRIRNKELRDRWHRKKQRIKELIKEAKAVGKIKDSAPKPPKKVKAAPAEDKPKRSPKKKADSEAGA